MCIKGVQDDAHFKHLVYKKQSVLLARRHTCDNTPHAQVTVQTVEATYLWRASACCHVHHGCCQGRHRGRGGGCRGRGWGSSCILLCGIRSYTAVYTHVCTCVYVCMCVCTRTRAPISAVFRVYHRTAVCVVAKVHIKEQNKEVGQN